MNRYNKLPPKERKRQAQYRFDQPEKQEKAAYEREIKKLTKLKKFCLQRVERIALDNADRCVCCGDVIPEGRQVCSKCEGGTNART